MRRRSLAAVTLGMLLSAPSLEAAIVLVTDLGDAPGACPSSSACTLRAAIAAANPGDTIAFDPAFAYPASLILGGTELGIGESITVLGPGPDRLTVSGASQSRVFNIDAGNVRIEGLAIANGLRQTVNASHGTPGTGAVGQPAQTAEGGCILVTLGSALVLERVALVSCQARGGDAGHGGSGVSGAVGGAGGSGGIGGSALGGAIAAFGELSLIESSIQGALAVGGRGGNGGDGGSGVTSGMGGVGGHGGAAQGAAVYAGAGGAFLARNATLTSSSASGGAGGSGGISNGLSGVGGNGGSVEGGQVYLDAGVVLADVEFVSLGPALMQPGAAGVGGGGAPPGASGMARGEAVFAGSSPRIRASVLVGEDVAIDCQGSVTASGVNIDSDDSCSGFSLQGTYASNFRGPSVQEEAGRAVLSPLPASLVIDAASDCNDLAAAPVPIDQSGRARPIDGDGIGGAACDVGALEYTPRIFASGFEG